MPPDYDCNIWRSTTLPYFLWKLHNFYCTAPPPQPQQTPVPPLLTTHKLEHLPKSHNNISVDRCIFNIPRYYYPTAAPRRAAHKDVKYKSCNHRHIQQHYSRSFAFFVAAEVVRIAKSTRAGRKGNLHHVASVAFTSWTSWYFIWRQDRIRFGN